MRLQSTSLITAFLVVLAIFVVFSVSAGDYFLTGRNAGNLARQISLDAPIVFGQTLVLIVGGIDLSVGSNMAMSAALVIGLQPLGRCSQSSPRLASAPSWAWSTVSSSPEAASCPSSRHWGR